MFTSWKGCTRGHDHGGHHLEDHSEGHSHTHGVVDPLITTTERGLWAVKWSFAGLMATALLQVVVVLLSNSVALLADTIHNLGDAATAIPLGVAFLLARLKPSQRFTFGFGRVEDLAGMLVVLTILFSAVVAGYQAVERLLNPQPIGHLGAVAAASLIGFLGNEAVAIFRIKIGQEISSAALVADGYHARVDGWTSLAVLGGALGIWLGYPLADPLVGLGVTVAILGIVWQSGKAVITRMLDSVEPEVIDEIRHAAHHVTGVLEVTEVRARWVGHRLHAEVNITVAPDHTAVEGHAIAKEVQHQLLHHVPYTYTGTVTIHVDPAAEAGEQHHHIIAHTHDGLPLHAH